MVRDESKLYDLLPEDPSVDDIGAFVSESYSCVGVDLRNLNQLEAVLKSAGVQKNGSRMPILVVSEVVLAYLGPEESDAVIKYFAQYPEGMFPICLWTDLLVLREQQSSDADISYNCSNICTP